MRVTFILISIFLSWALPNLSKAADCAQSFYSFGAKYQWDDWDENCDRIVGSVRFDAGASKSVDTEVFSQITEVTGEVYFNYGSNNPDGWNYRGLRNLTRIGTLKVKSPSDDVWEYLAALESVAKIEVVAYFGPVHVKLSGLREVDNLDLQFFPSSISPEETYITLDLPALVTAHEDWPENYYCSSNCDVVGVKSISAPQLTEVKGLFKSLGAHEFPQLTSIGGNAGLGRYVVAPLPLATLYPKLAEVGGNLTIATEFTSDNSTLPSLQRVGGDFTVKVPVANLQPYINAGLEVSGTLSATVSESLQGLEWAASVGGLKISTSGENYISLEQIAPHINENLNLNLEDGRFVDLSPLSETTVIRELSISEASFLNQPQLPNLKSVGFLRLHSGFSLISSLTALESVGTLNVQAGTRLDWDHSAQSDYLANLDGFKNLHNVGDFLIRSLNDLPTYEDPVLCDGLLRLWGWPSGPPNFLKGYSFSGSCPDDINSVNNPPRNFISDSAISVSANQISLNMVPLAKDGTAFPVEGHRLTCESPDGQIHSVEGNGYLSLDGLVTGVTYTCLPVVYLQDLGDVVDSYFPQSFKRTPETNTSVPPKPTITRFTGSANNGRVEFFVPSGWDFVTEVNASCVSGENVSVGGTQYPQGAVTLSDLGGVVNPKMQPMLQGLEYQCTATATNTFGTSEPSDPATVVWVGQPEPPNIYLTQHGDSWIKLYISEGDDGGAETTSIEAACTGPTGTETLPAANSSGAFGSGSVHVVQFDNLTNGEEYICSAVAVNAEGKSSPSNSVAVTPRGVPYQPTITQAYGDWETLFLEVEVDDRGALITDVVAECNSPNRGSFQSAESPTVLSVDTYLLQVLDLPNGEVFTCSVAATNSEGTSPMSLPSEQVRVGRICDQQNLSFYSQAEIDNFEPDCSEISGHLDILGVSNIDKLSVFTHLGGNLRIRSTQLTNFDALSGLTFGGGNLEISLNDNLQSLSGFQSLTSLQGTLSVDDRDLTSMEGLNNLSSVGGGVYLGEMLSLTSLDGLGSLQTVGGDFSLASSLVSSLQGLGSLQTVAGGFALSYNPNLTTLAGLENLTSVGGQLYVGNADELTSLSGLGPLQSIGGELVLYQLPKLANIDALASLKSVGNQVNGGIQITGATLLQDIDGLINVGTVVGSVVLTDNPALRDVDGLFGLEGGLPGSIIISDNGSLRTLDGLGNLQTVGLDFTVTGNGTLSNCTGAAVLLGYPQGPPDDLVSGDIQINNNAFGCNSVDQIFDSIQGPSKPVIDSAVPGNGSITLSYTASAGDPAFPIKEYGGVCEGPRKEFSESPAAPVLDNQPVERSYVVSGFDPVSVAPDVTVEIDISHDDPIELTVELISPAGTVVTLWDKEDTAGQSIVATYNLWGSQTFPGESGDGTWRLRVTDDETGPIAKEGVLNSWSIMLREQNISTSTTSTMTFTGLTNGRLYSCTVSPRSNLSIYPVSDPVEVTPVAAPATQPAAPRIMRIDAEDGEVMVWIEVVDDGGGTISEYRATCTDGTNTFTGTSTTNRVTVAGLSNEVPYTCTASITTEAGTSDESAESPPVIPEEAMTGLPIWLLYEATKAN